MRKRSIRIWSMFMVIVMICNMLPLHAMAVEDDTGVIAGESATQITSEEDAYIVEEIIEGRSEFIKEFQLSNGLHMAAVYGSAVHYEEDGQWLEIDNTLKLANTRSGNVYTNTAGSWQVSFPQSLTQNNGVTITRGDYSLNFRMSGELHHMGNGTEIMDVPDAAVDTDLDMPEDSLSETAPAAAEEMNDAGAATTVPTEGATVPAEETTAPTEETNASTEEPTAPAEESTASTEETAAATEETTAPTEETTAPTEATEPSEESSQIAADSNISEEATWILDIISTEDALSLAKPATESTAIVEPVDTAALLAGAEHEETVVDKIYSKLEYADVYSNTDVVFELKSNQVKESIIINQYDASLYGYTYLLDMGNMIPVLTDSGEIQLYDAQGEELVMIMPAPYLLDDVGEYCDDVTVALDESNGTYVLSYLLPQEWLADEDRKWPVILDPIVYATATTSNIRDIAIYSKTYLGHQNGVLQCGNYADWGLGRIYVKYEQLPVLSSADVIVGATVTLHTSTTPITAAGTVEVHKVTSTWKSETITWANKPAPISTIEDFQICQTTNTDYTWDITDIVRGWYEGTNTGMMFKVDDTTEASTSESRIQFYSSDYGVLYKPTVEIMFRNNNGLESYWDYTALSAGRAGTGYVNQYSGNLVWVREDIGFGGNRMPVAISHVYNANDSTKNLFGVGNGWRTNFNQRVYLWTTNSNYYVWEDADGTAHYFLYASPGIYKDEDGLELTLTTTGSGTEKYCIADKYGNCSYFDTYGRLTKLSNNQATKSSITVTYTSASAYPIATITDGAGRVYNFSYNGSQLIEIWYQNGVSYVSFGYSGSNLTSITDKDGKSSTYTYTTNNLLSTAEDIDGYKLSYTYTTTATGKPNRVKTISEHSGSTAGGTLSIEYAHNQTKFTDYNGNVQIVQFNNWGNTVSIQDDLGRAQYAQYAFHDATSASSEYTNPKGNQLRVASKLQNTVGNVLKDSSFENSTVWSSTNTSYSSCSIDSANAYLGSKSLKITHGSSTVEAGAYSPYFTIKPGQTYTFSAYVKTGESAAYLCIGSQAVGYFYGDKIPANQNWTREEFSYTNNSNADQNVYAYILSDGPGVTYLDCVQVEKAPTASRYNLIENGDFRYTTGWSSTAGITTLSAAAPELQSSVYQITGSPTATKRISQTVQVSGSAGDTFVLAGWAKGDSVPLSGSREFAMIATFKNGTSTVGESKVVQFNPDTDSTVAWQYAADAIEAPGAYTSIVIELAYDYNANTAYFDGIQLYKEEFGSSYSYDANGNVTKVNDVQGGATTYTYTGNDLTTVTLPDGSVTTYTYDSYHNVKTAKTNTGVTYNLTYDTYGNNTKVSITSGSVALSSSAAYTSDGNFLASTTDAAGKVTSYTYKSTDTGEIGSVTYPNGAVSNYTYDTMYRLATSTMSTGSQTLSATYGYTNDQLTSLKTGSTTYTFAYGAFCQMSSIKIGSQTLASYTYTSRNNYLDTLAYGNGDSVKYTYDKQGRVTKQAYEDGDTVTYKYDNNGALGTVTDSETGRTTTYYYDFADRLTKYAEKGSGYSHIVGYTYDTVNNLTGLVETINGTTRTTSYAYDDDNRLTGVTTQHPLGNVNVSITYDAYGRIATLNNGVFTRTYNYRTVDGRATAQIESFTHSTITSAYDYEQDYAYEYDSNGNITSATFGKYTNTFAYDSANQLVRENNDRKNYTQTWTYDDAGNILSTSTYDFTTGDDLGTPTQTITYTYSDSAWGDLLTGYNGQTITYDAIGNPLTIKDAEGNVVRSYTWEHGRQLKSMIKNGVTWTYTYDANGMRTKQTNGTDTYEYVYNGDQLTRMVYNGVAVDIIYAGEIPVAMTYNGDIYYYIQNAQGDIIGLTDSEGNLVLGYTYRAYGVPTALLADANLSRILYQYNPLTYRGYVSDVEAGIYYLQSRYYTPNRGRFLNADAYTSTGQGLLGNNMFAYCGNNPISRVDHDGQAWETVLDIISLGSSIAGVAVNPADPWAWLALVGDMADVAIPFVGGLGEAARAANVAMEVADTVDDIRDAGKMADIAQVATNGTPNDIGKIGEQLAGIDPGAKVSIQVNGRTRIPDAMTDTALTEVKNVKYISNTQQLRDFASYANATGRSLELFVRPTTKVAQTVIDAGWNINYLW